MAYRPTSAPNIATWCSKPLPEGQIRVLYRFDDETVNLIDACSFPTSRSPAATASPQISLFASMVVHPGVL